MLVRPRIKPEHSPYRISGNKIRIGGSIYGIAAELNDPTGEVWTLLESLDGSRSVEQVVDYVRARTQRPSVQEIKDALTDLVNAGYVENCGAAEPVELSARERERYERS